MAAAEDTPSVRSRSVPPPVVIRNSGRVDLCSSPPAGGGFRVLGGLAAESRSWRRPGRPAGGWAAPLGESLKGVVTKRFNAMFYGAMVWDPWLIVAQITVLQCLHYLSLGGLLWLFVGSHELDFTLHHFFDWRYMTVRTLNGWLTMLAFLCNAFVG